MSRKPREIKKVLVIKLGDLGGFVLALAAMKRIRQAHPRARITLLTSQPYEALARSSPYFNEVDPGGRPEGFGEWLSLIRRLRRAKYDRVYDLQTDRQSKGYYNRLGLFKPQWSGTVGSHPQKGKAREQMHTLERHADQLRIAGIWDDAPTEPGSAPPPDLSWILRKAVEQRRVAGGVKPRPYVLLVPGGSARKKDKRWPIGHYADLAAILRAQGFDIVVVGGPEESALARAIQAKAQSRDLTGRTDFAQIALLASRAALAVGNDTGPLHLIAGAGAPTLALFSKSSDPELHSPRGHVTVLRANNLADLPVADVARACQHLIPRDTRP